MYFLPGVIIDCRADGRIMDKDLAHQLGIDRDPLPHHVLGQITHQKSPVHVSLSAEHPETMKFLLNLLPCLPPFCVPLSSVITTHKGVIWSAQQT